MFVQPKFTPDDITRQECLREVSRCGQFEGCHTATPYMWNRVMQWGESPDYDCYDQLGWLIGEMNEDEFEDLPLVFRYGVDIQDVANFPELKGIDYVLMWQDDSGFIHDQGIELEPSPLSISIHYADMQVINNLRTMVEYQLAIWGVGPKPTDGIGTDDMIRIQDGILNGIVKYFEWHRSQ